MDAAVWQEIFIPIVVTHRVCVCVYIRPEGKAQIPNICCILLQVTLIPGGFSLMLIFYAPVLDGEDTLGYKGSAL